jgi:hypothetical protein
VHRSLDGPLPEAAQADLRNGRFGEAVRLGDWLPKPTALDVQLSLFLKDIWMIPASAAREV